MRDTTHHQNPCACCPPIPQRAPMRKPIAVGFGDAYVCRDGEVVIDGEWRLRNGEEPPTFRDAERLAKADPNHVWQVVLYGPLHGETYERKGVRNWQIVERNEGFA